MPFDHLLGIDRASTHTLLESPRLNGTWEQPPELVLLSGDGHTWIALDYRRRTWRSREPRVVFYDNEAEEEVVLAPTFRAFVERLEPAPEIGADDVPDPEWRDELAALAYLLDPAYRAEFRRALGDDAARDRLRAELVDFAHRLDPRYATAIDPATSEEA